MVGRGAQREEMLWVKIRDFRCSYLVQKVFKFLLHNSHDFFMFYGYHITINRKTSDTDAAYKIFFIILELISDYQLSSLFQIIILSKKSTRRGAFFRVSANLENRQTVLYCRVRFRKNIRCGFT